MYDLKGPKPCKLSIGEIFLVYLSCSKTRRMFDILGAKWMDSKASTSQKRTQLRFLASRKIHVAPGSWAPRYHFSKNSGRSRLWDPKKLNHHLELTPTYDSTTQWDIANLRLMWDATLPRHRCKRQDGNSLLSCVKSITSTFSFDSLRSILTRIQIALHSITSIQRVVSFINT